MIRHLWMNDSLNDAIAVPRIHHNLRPMLIEYEVDYDVKMLEGLESKGHKIEESKLQLGFSAIAGISKAHNILEVSTDPRRNGSTAIY